MTSSIQSTAGITRVTSLPDPAAAGRGTADAATDAVSTTAAATAAVAEQSTAESPKPLRFPWLSRLSQQLEPAAKQKSTFASAPVLGDNVDKQA